MFLFYNTLSGQHFTISPKEFLASVVEKLQDIDNGYCVELSESELTLKEIKDFVRSLRANYCGDIIAQKLTKMKPFSLYPTLSVMKNREIQKSDTYLSMGERILNFLHVLTVQITGICDLKYQTNLEAYKQILSCSYSDNELDYEVIESIFKQISGCNFGSINIIGGDIFRYSEWKKLMLLLHQYAFRYYFFTDYRLLPFNEKKLQELVSLSSCLHVTVSGEFEESVLKKAIHIIPDMDSEVIFQITSEEQFLAAKTFCENNQIENCSSQPVYTGSNLDFFRNFIFMDETSIVETPVSKQTIYANMTLNASDFGKITIVSSGDVYANLNFPKLGNIKTDSIRDLLFHELYKGDSWFRIRDQKPCSECIYQWLCSPPSNYELCIGQPNLCHIKK